MIPLRNIKLKCVGRLSGHPWEQLDLAAHCKGNLLFTPCGGAPVIHDLHVMTLADAAVFAAAKAYSWKFSTWYRWLYHRIGKKAQCILTVSDFSKRELQKWCSIPLEKITVTHAGCEHILRTDPDRSILDKYGLNERPFVLAVGSMNPNKNLQGIAEAIHRLRSRQLTFALAGSVNSSVFGQHAPLPSNVVRLGFVTDAQLRALYEKALCFVFPSFYEGFGLPPLEAMACGCPVIVSRTASLPEVCGDAADYCNPNDPADIAQKIQDITEDAGKRRQFVEKGALRACLFTWERAARGAWNVLKRAIAASRC